MLNFFCNDNEYDEVMTLTNKAVAEALDGLPVHKLHCSVLAEEAIKAAVDDYRKKNPPPDVREAD